MLEKRKESEPPKIPRWALQRWTTDCEGLGQQYNQSVGREELLCGG